jgi:hypothetical protein
VVPSGSTGSSGTSAPNGTSGTSGVSGTSGLSFNGTSGISGGTFTNQPDYLVKTTNTTTIQSVSFLSVSGTTLRITGLTHTDTLRVDNPGGGFGPAAVGPPDTLIGGITAAGVPNHFLGEPDAWLFININGNDYQFPGYSG